MNGLNHTACWSFSCPSSPSLALWSLTSVNDTSEVESGALRVGAQHALHCRAWEVGVNNDNTARGLCGGDNSV